MNKFNGVICSSPMYVYKGVLFEVHSFCGPYPLKKDYKPKKRIGNKFYDLYSEFCKLSKEEQEKCKVYDGGCQFF